MLKRSAQAVAVGTLALGSAIHLCVTSASATGTGPDDGALVRTDRGVVRGTLTDTARVFQGIPYAAPPTGDRRWAPPAPARRWHGVRDAGEPGAACPQTGVVPPAGPASDDEDCLHVNVTTPRTASAERRPVMVYLHGGDHTDGEGAMHGAQRLAAQGDVIVVTVNYRLGALGYLAHPALERRGESGNFGFLDQQAALRWVQRNASAFGGDPDNVTLFGESAGGHSTCAHLVAPSSAGLFDRAILQSAPCTSGMSSRNRAGALAQGKATVVDIQETNGLADWRDATPGQLVNPFGTGPAYGPVYGGALLPRTPQEALPAGRFTKVPVLQGINRDEERARVYGLELAKKATTGDPDAQLEESDYRAHLNEEFGAEAAAAIAARYPISAYDDSPALALAAALTDGIWARTSVGTSRALAAHTPTYTYEFADAETPWYSDPQYRKPGFPAGAGHTFELPYLFDLDAYESLTPAQQELAEKMIEIWTDFARTGRAAWKPATPATPNTQSLASGPDGIHPVDFARQHQYDFWKSLD
jgi:para-nitrobenzyl esterase